MNWLNKTFLKFLVRFIIIILIAISGIFATNFFQESSGGTASLEDGE